MKGRMRKAKKAYKKGTGNVPLWWNGSFRQQTLQIRYYFLIRLREWQQLQALKNFSVVVATTSSAFQIAALNSLPRPKEMEREEWVKDKAARIVEITANTARLIANTLSELPPRPKVVDYIKPAFSTCYPSKKKKKNWVEEAFLGVDHGQGRDHAVQARWSIDMGVLVKMENVIPQLPPTA
jgi:hypothetical protein